MDGRCVGDGTVLDYTFSTIEVICWEATNIRSKLVHSVLAQDLKVLGDVLVVEKYQMESPNE